MLDTHGLQVTLHSSVAAGPTGNPRSEPQLWVGAARGMSGSYRGFCRSLSLSHPHAKVMASLWVSAQLGSSCNPSAMEQCPFSIPDGWTLQCAPRLQFGRAAGISQGAQSSWSPVCPWAQGRSPTHLEGSGEPVPGKATSLEDRWDRCFSEARASL